MKQYFDNKSSFDDEEKEIKFNDDGLNLTFLTNSGMFSKDHIDEHSLALVRQIKASQTDEALDLGCGYGFIGIYLQKKYQTNVTFIDITTRACEYTNLNCQKNDINKYEVLETDGVSIDKQFDIITLNPPIHAGKEVVYRLYQESLAHLKENGSLYLVINKKHGAKSTIAYLESLKSRVEILSKKKGLYILQVKKLET